jgi:ligand-binding sensor domain-containing protein/tRNA A-37 threonylcarbamoyl transferase component Bud32
LAVCGIQNDSTQAGEARIVSALRSEILHFIARAAQITLFLIFPSFPVLGLDPNKQITQYLIESWGEKQGIPQNTIHSIVQTRDGYLWIGTEGGGLTRHKAGVFTTWTVNEGLPDNFVISILEGPDNSLWIATAGGLSKFQNNKFTTYRKKDGLISDRTFCLLIDHQGDLWIGSPGGLNRLRNGKFDTFTAKDGLSNERIYTILEDHDRNIWIGTAGGGLNQFRNGKFTAFTTKDGLGDNHIFALHEDQQRNLWIGTLGGGLNRYRDGKFSLLTTKQGLASDYIYAITEDSEQSLWLATGTAGLNQLRDGKVTFFSTNEGFVSEQVFDIFQDSRGTIWAGTDGALHRFVDGRFVPFTENGSELRTTVYDIYGDKKQNLWIACRDKFKVYRNGQFQDVPIDMTRLGNSIPHLLVDQNEILWVGSRNGLYQMKNGVVSTITTKEGISSNYVNSLFNDDNGILWIGTSLGLDQMQNGKLTHTKLLNGNISSLLKDKLGNFWIAAYGKGLHLLRDGKFYGFTTKDGLFNDKIEILLEDDHQRLWIGSSGGIFWISKKELLDFAEQKIQRFTSVTFGTEDGLLSKDTYAGGCKTRDGKLWFGTSRGAVLIDPARIPQNKVLPGVIIEDVLVDDHKIPTGDYLDRELTLAPGNSILEFRYTGTSLRIPDRVRFRIKLEGSDTDWTHAETRRFAHYRNLPSGRYRFHVIASNDDGVWSKPAVVSFYLKPYFYQTTWFLALCIMAFAASGYAAYRIRIWSLKKRELELIRTVEEQTLELRRANEKLREAQERIAWLVQSGPQALENVSVWSKLVAEELAVTLTAKELSVWTVEDNHLKPLVPGTAPPPSLQEVRSLPANIVARNKEMLFPVRGMTGDTYGVLVVSGTRAAWDETQMRLLAGFSHQLGGALEMLRMRDQLARSEEKRMAIKQDMKEQGLVTVQICSSCDRCYADSVTHCEEDGSLLESPYLYPHKIADRYRLIRYLGKGASGTVFEAIDEMLDRSASVKIIASEFTSDPIMKMRVKREAQLIAQIRHPGVVTIYDFGKLADGSSYFVMELLKGRDLQKMLRQQGAGTPKQVSTVLHQVGDALRTTHSLGIIHRDLKPANLFIVPSGSDFQTKVLDFGLAKSVNEDSSLTLSGIVMGTPAYMSPEQVRGEPMDARSDLFSLAVVAYELLTARRVFHADSVPELFTKVLMETPAPLGSKLEGIPAELDDLFLQALQKDSQKRPQSLEVWIAQVVAQLEKISSTNPGWTITL